ncbi:MAG: NUDIX hydrolase [Bacteroidales bacterium]|nr:NUDIX hydrolase [Bacteroidales bacterium]MBN2763609.1 NUDIX hydrolase [Bacteroidales bacterium]
MPKTTVGAVLTRVIDGEVRILLTRRNVEPYKNYWCIPGGHIEENENALDAVIREVQEETGLDMMNVEFLGYQDEIIPERGVHNVALMFSGNATNEAKASPDEVTEIGWFTIAEAKKMDLAFRHKEAIQLFLSRRDKHNDL